MAVVGVSELDGVRVVKQQRASRRWSRQAARDRFASKHTKHLLCSSVPSLPFVLTPLRFTNRPAVYFPCRKNFPRAFGSMSVLYCEIYDGHLLTICLLDIRTACFTRAPDLYQRVSNHLVNITSAALITHSQQTPRHQYYDT